MHVAGIHLSRASEPGGNAKVVREKLGSGYNLLRAALGRRHRRVACVPGPIDQFGGVLEAAVDWPGRGVRRRGNAWMSC